MGLKYSVDLLPDTEIGGFSVHVRDMSSAFSQGESREEALEMALSVFLDLLDLNYFENRLLRPVPLPSLFEGDDYIEIPDDITHKIMDYNARLGTFVL